MPPAPPSDRELDAYRDQADRFIAELDEEFYLHYAGLKETFDLAQIYERHKNLTELDQVKSIGLAVNRSAAMTCRPSAGSKPQRRRASATSASSIGALP